jgi:hypothetical protein
MKSIGDIIKKCQDNCGAQRLKAPGDRGYFCGLSYDNYAITCSEFDPERTYKFGFGPEYSGCKFNGILQSLGHKKERAVFCPKRKTK